MREPYASMPGGQAIALRNDRWKTLFYTAASTELYDLQSDPGEMTNLASKQPERVATFRSELDTWLEGKSILPRDHADLDPHDYELLKSLGYIQE
jgi:arylsulfatase A-like enzyme